MDPLRSAAAGDWLKPRIDIQWHDMHAVVPRGFPAYARIFHPAWRDHPEATKTWHGHELPARGAVQGQEVGWSDVALAFGKHMHALTQFGRLTGPEIPRLGPVDAAGWRYGSPELGNLNPEKLAAAAVHLCAHTSTPNQGVTGIWEGYGGLTSSSGYVELTFVDDGVQPDYGGGSEAPNAEPGTGLLPAEVVNGERLQLPGRSYFLFDTAPRIYLEPGWLHEAPWHHSPDSPQSPNLLWPADKSWVLVSEIDFDSTIVGGSWDLISALAQDPAIEALAIQEGADLTWDADVHNRPAQ
ncbi:hypothetical protein AOC05_13095 [Arthrobacter alpinus]|uniref:Uncharacterized protein n=1 Tax=Arthrobacter alpinus TaxID=656366 RepID=A0A0M3UGN3_9MICC|nr:MULTISPECIES: hypothetical protein [Arthrobacter]ALE93029.1 hypothetical protein AOC05_13095 [Arthrobacter alpinus]